MASTATSLRGGARVRASSGRRAAAAAGARPARSSTRTRDAYFQFARNTVRAMAKNFPAPLKCVDAVAAVDQEEVRRRPGVRARALHRADAHARIARRCATPSWPSAPPSKIPDVPDDTPQREIKKVAVIGAGTMGGGIAMNFLNAGIPVDDARDEAGSARPRRRPPSARTTRRRSRRASSSRTSSTQRMALLTTTLDYDDLEGRRPRDRGRVRGHGRQGAGVQDSSTR